MTVSYLKLSGVITAEEPLHIGSGRRTGVIKHSYPYIPGSFLRGAWGTLLVKSVCKYEKPPMDHSDCEHAEGCLYMKLFNEERQRSSGIFFRYAYPLHLKCGGVYRPAPKTLYECENSQCGKTFDVLNPPDEHDTCRGKLKPYTGFICDVCGERARKPIILERVTSTAIDSTLSSAAMVDVAGSEKKAGTLHTLEAIPRGSKFHLEAVIHEKMTDDAEAIKAIFVRGLPDEGIGGSRSRGYGKISVNDVRIEAVDVKAVEKRAEGINPSRFSVRVMSPLLLGDVLKPRSLLEGARRAYSWVYREGKPALPELYLEASRLELEPHSGWSNKTGMRRRLEQALSPGSLFQFRCEDPPGLLTKALAALEVYPLGDYKPHGCGQLSIEDPRV